MAMILQLKRLGGHTDYRPFICLLPSAALRAENASKYLYQQPVRMGQPADQHPIFSSGAFHDGAAYVVTGLLTSLCRSGASIHTKSVSRSGMADVAMAPSADMFEMGVKVQVLKRCTLFPMRAAKLYEMYTRYDSVENIPTDEREKLEKQVFQRSMDSVWQDTVKFFTERDPLQIENAVKNPNRKMALIFRWYLGLSSRWSNSGEPGREMDYQIWCGPSMGSFNDWTRSTYMAKPENRHIVDVTLHLFTGAAWHYRIQQMKMQGLRIPAAYETIIRLYQWVHNVICSMEGMR